MRLEASMSIRGNFESHIHLHIVSLSCNVQHTVVIVDSLHRRVGNAQLSSTVREMNEVSVIKGKSNVSCACDV